MKQALFFLAVFGCLVSTYSAPAQRTPTPLLGPPIVDQRVELLAIVARLAGFKEYSDTSNRVYIKAIHRHFDPYLNHPVIRLAKVVRDSLGLGYDAVMAMAVHLSQPPALQPLLPFTDSIPDRRWGSMAAPFADLLRAFFADANCAEFFGQVQPLYDAALGRYRTIFDKLDLNWYKRFYGRTPTTTFHVVLGMGDGGGNFGPRVVYPGGREDVYAIEGVDSVDASGIPVFPEDWYLPTLVHEFNHSFVNYLSDLNLRALEGAGRVLFDSVKTVMARQAYASWQTVENEALVRAAVVRYLMEHPDGGQPPMEELGVQVNRRGFFWLRSLVTLLGRYESERTTFPTLESFMPEIVHFYDTLAPDIAAYQRRLSDSSIRVVRMGPFQPGDTDVVPGIREISFTFDRPFFEGHFQLGPSRKGAPGYEFVGASYSPDHKTILLKLNLKPNTFYEMYTGGSFFISMDGYPAKRFEFRFRTGAQ
ncbi:MAG TPA: DUF4932 domain-containing protein [Puia sp.]|nr:DUF4932 domain-containing protein [Puia sp.]